MSGIRIANERDSERGPAPSPAAASMLLWAGLLALVWGLLAKFNFVAIGTGMVLCLLAGLQARKVGKKVCPGCGVTIGREATTCPACLGDEIHRPP